MSSREVLKAFLHVSVSGTHFLHQPRVLLGTNTPTSVPHSFSLPAFFSRLGNNHITASGAQVLAEGLRANASLQFLG